MVGRQGQAAPVGQTTPLAALIEIHFFSTKGNCVVASQQSLEMYPSPVVFCSESGWDILWQVKENIGISGIAPQ